MGVYLVSRSYYDGPTGKSVQWFDDESVLAWFQNRWEDVEKDGRDASDFLFFDDDEEWPPCPESDEQLAAVLEEHCYCEGEFFYEPHLFQFQSDDDELEFALYLFDDEFLRQNRDKAAFLLYDETQLPEEYGTTGIKASEPTTPLSPAGSGEGATYLIFSTYYATVWLSDLDGGYRIDGVRLPDLCDYLAGVIPDTSAKDDGGWYSEVRLLRTLTGSHTALAPLLGQVGQLPLLPLHFHSWTPDFGIGDTEDALTQLQAALAIISDDRGEVRSFSQIGSHVAQLFAHVQTEASYPDKRPQYLYHRWIFFDDLWLAANRTLGEAILRYASRWNVLTAEQDAAN